MNRKEKQEWDEMQEVNEPALAPIRTRIKRRKVRWVKDVLLVKSAQKDKIETRTYSLLHSTLGALSRRAEGAFKEIHKC